MKKREERRTVDIEFEVNDVQAFGNGNRVVPYYCADNITNGCYTSSSDINCTDCNQTTSCTDLYTTVGCGMIDYCVDQLRDR